MKNRVITISREFGSGGRTIGKQTAAVLNIPCYDRKLVEQGPCVIVGRCADYILRDKADCLRVFVHANQEFRARRILKEYGERETPAVQRLRDKDKRRAAYHRFYTDMKWGHAQNYDLTLNSGTLGIDRCVAIIADLFLHPNPDRPQTTSG